MNDTSNGKVSLFKKMDQAVFQQIDLFRKSPNYAGVQDFYNGLEEEQQKIFKAGVLTVLCLLPLLLLAILLWQNSLLKADLALRTSIVTKANEILGQNRGLREIGPTVLAPNPIDSQSMMTSRLGTLASGIGVDLSKLQVKDFTSEMISSMVMRSEATFSFSNLSTAELTGLFTNMINRERFRISSLEVKRNPSSNLLQGQFRAIHYSSVAAPEEE